MISVKGLTKYYGETKAIDNLSFEVPQGEILGFLGPNGAGKSTSMRILTCHISPTSGTASIDGYDIKKDSIEVRKRIGYLPENAPLYLEMSVFEYLKFMAEIKGYSGNLKNKYASEAMEQAGLTSTSNRIIGNLSKGFRQRVGIAQAILGDPKVLILDEPTVGLDPKQIIEIRSLIKSLGRKRTVVISTHILPEVSMVCSQVVVINQGKIAAQGTPERLVSDMSKTPEILVSVSAEKNLSGKIEKILQDIKGVKNASPINEEKPGILEYSIKCERGSDPRAEISKSIVNCGFNLVGLHMKGLSLEELFIKIISGNEEDSDAA